MFVMPIKALRFEGAASVSCIITASFLTVEKQEEGVSGTSSQTNYKNSASAVKLFFNFHQPEL